MKKEEKNIEQETTKALSKTNVVSSLTVKDARYIENMLIEKLMEKDKNGIYKNESNDDFIEYIDKLIGRLYGKS